MHLMDDLLEKTSRTFALAIPLLPPRTREATCLAYLLFRVTDTLEDAELWPRDARLSALEDLGSLLCRAPDATAHARATSLSRAWLATPPSGDVGCLELLGAFPLLFEELARQAPEARRIILAHGARTAIGMHATLRRADARGHLELRNLEELRDYCYIVAGIVGELLTELFLYEAPELEKVRETLVAHQVFFGEGLQLVNILKDETHDTSDGRTYLPPGVSRAEVALLARRDLVRARAYIEALEEGGAPRGFVAFTTLSADLADATLDRLEEEGAGAKVPRSAVMQMFAKVQRLASLAR
jgi:farnesyl-diphosphate farnesyltransferase